MTLEEKLTESGSCVKVLRKANNTPADLIVEIDMGPDHRFAGQGFHREKPRRFISKVKFEVRRVVEPGQPTVIGSKMLEVAKANNCDTTLEEGERIVTFLNSRAGRPTYEAIQEAGFWCIVLPHKDGIWMLISGVRRFVPLLDCYGERCVSDLFCLSRDFGSSTGLLVPRE